MPDMVDIRWFALPLVAVASTLIAAPAAPTLHPGLWRVENTPTQATLDGRRLEELPYSPAPPEDICLSAFDAADPARWFARDQSPDCIYSRRAAQGGKVDVIASCPSPGSGQPRGNVAITGKWSAERYDLRFATTTFGDNGRMGFAGTMTGRRVGDCPAS